MEETFYTTSNQTQVNSVEKLQERIAELEKELQNQKAKAEKGAKILKMMYGDHFQGESLH